MPSGATPAASVKNRADRKQGSLQAQLQNSALLFPCTIVSTVLALAAGGQDTRVARAGPARQRTRIAVCSCVPRRAGRRTFCPSHPRLCSVWLSLSCRFLLQRKHIYVTLSDIHECQKNVFQSGIWKQGNVSW